MILLGVVLLATGVIMNFKVLRGPLSKRLTSEQMMHTQPWLLSVGLIGAGLLCVLIGAR